MISITFDKLPSPVAAAAAGMREDFGSAQFEMNSGSRGDFVARSASSQRWFE